MPEIRRCHSERYIDTVREDIADRHAGGRVVSMLEGGYNVEGLASALLAHVGALIDA